MEEVLVLTVRDAGQVDRVVPVVPADLQAVDQDRVDLRPVADRDSDHGTVTKPRVSPFERLLRSA